MSPEQDIRSSSATSSASSASSRFETPQQGADLFFQAAIQYGYRYVFGNPGTTEAPFMDALVRYPDLHFLLFLQENSATGAAAGVACMTGWPAIVNLHLAPGLANGLSNIHNARRAQVPMIVTVGDHDVRHLLDDSPLAGDIEGIARSMCKWTWTVKYAGELADVLHRATTIAMTPPQGPVCLILPTNILSTPPRTADGRIPMIPELHLPVLGAAPRQDIQRTIDALLAAQHAAILVGDMEPAACKHVETLAALSHARVVYNSFPRRFEGPILPGSTWLPYFPEQRRALFAQTDLLLMLGVSSFVTLFLYERDAVPILRSETQVIQLNDDLAALGKNERGSIPLYGDITATLELMVTALHERVGDAQGDNEGTTGTEAAASVKKDIFAAAGPLRPKELMQALRQELPANTILVDEAITSRQVMVEEIMNVGTPVISYLGVRGGSLGGGIPLAVGAKLSMPDHPVVAIIGDGSAMYTIQALWTMARYHLPVLVVICNNASYDIIKLELLRLQGTLATANATILNAVTGLGEPRLDFVQLAAGMGVQGWSVRDGATLLSSLQEALEVCANGEPALVDVQFTSLPR